MVHLYFKTLLGFKQDFMRSTHCNTPSETRTSSSPLQALSLCCSARALKCIPNSLCNAPISLIFSTNVFNLSYMHLNYIIKTLLLSVLLFFSSFFRMASSLIFSCFVAVGYVSSDTHILFRWLMDLKQGFE